MSQAGLDKWWCWHSYSDKVFSYLSPPGEWRMWQRNMSALHTPNTTLRHLTHFIWPKYLDTQGLTLDTKFLLNVYQNKFGFECCFRYENIFYWTRYNILLILIMKMVNFVYFSTRLKSCLRSQEKWNICSYSDVFSLPFPFHMSFLPFPFSGLPPPYTYQVMEAKEIREGLQLLTAADLSQLLSHAGSSAALCGKVLH